MRLIGMVLSLGVIIWVMVQAAGGDGESVISQGHQDALEKARALETTVQDSFEDQFSALENAH